VKKIYKSIGVIISLLVIALIIAVISSPYGKSEGFDYRLVKHTVHIDASKDSVFSFLGNSANARKWSVFVHHISPLNDDSIPDGLPGSKRRCYCKADETGTRWDETILEVQPGKRRLLSCYAFIGFPITAEGIATEQIFESNSDGTTDLTFTFFIKDREPSLSEYLKLHIGSYKLHSIFKQNLENIKAICEGKPVIYPIVK